MQHLVKMTNRQFNEQMNAIKVEREENGDVVMRVFGYPFPNYWSQAEPLNSPVLSRLMESANAKYDIALIDDENLWPAHMGQPIPYEEWTGPEV